MKNIKFLSLLLISSFLISNLAYSQNWRKGRITGEGGVVSETLNIADFTGIALGVKGEVYITKGPQSVKVEGQKNIIDNLKRDVKGDTWNIGFEDNVKNHIPLKFYISMPTVTELAIGGSGTIIAKNDFNNLGDLEMAIAGSGTIEIGGSAEEVEISIAGSGDVKSADLSVKECTIEIAGSGKAYIEVSEELDVSIAGSGDVRYKGSPRVKSSIAGSGDVSSMR